MIHAIRTAIARRAFDRANAAYVAYQNQPAAMGWNHSVAVALRTRLLLRERELSRLIATGPATVKPIHLAMVAHAAALAAFLALAAYAGQRAIPAPPTQPTPAVAACDTDSDCAARFGGDGGPAPARASGDVFDGAR